MKKTKKNSDFEFRNITRSEKNKVIAGIAGGLGEYFNIDPIIFRIIFLLFFVYGGSGLLIYFILWLIIPKKNKTMKDNVSEIKDKAEEIVEKFRRNDRRKNRGWFGYFLILLGVVFLLDNLGFIVIRQIWNYWPLLLVFIGLAIVSRNE